MIIYSVYMAYLTIQFIEKYRFYWSYLVDAKKMEKSTYEYIQHYYVLKVAYNVCHLFYYDR